MPDEIPEAERFKPGQTVRCLRSTDSFDARAGELYVIEVYYEQENRDEPDVDPPYYSMEGVKSGNWVCCPHADLELYDFEKEGPIPMPHYAEFVAIKRVVLQGDATGEEDWLAKMKEFAKDGSCMDMAMSDEAPVVLIHEPYGSEEVGQSDGHSWFVGNLFGDGKAWMRELGEKLIAMSEEN